MFEHDEETGGCGIGPCGSIPFGSRYEGGGPVVDLGPAQLIFELEDRALEFEYDDV